MEQMEKPQHTAEQTAQNYIRLLWWPVTMTAIFTITALYNVNQQLLTIIAHGGLMVYVVLLLAKRKHHARWQEGALIGGIAGGIVAAMVALYKLITFFDLVYIFNLATQPLFTGIVDSLLAGLIMILLQYVQRSRRAHLPMTIKNQTPQQR